MSNAINKIVLKWDGVVFPLFDTAEYKCEKIENLTWGNSELSTSTNPSRAGDIVQNRRPMPRDIVITLKPTSDKGDYSNLIHKFARMFNKSVTLFWESRRIPSFIANVDDYTADFILNGVVNEFETPRFDDGVRIVLGVHCENPYWTATSSIVKSSQQGQVLHTCLYSDVGVGFKLIIPNLEFTASTQQVTVNINSAQPNRALFTLYIRPIWRGSTISGAFNSFEFKNGIVTILSGADEASATDATSKFQWYFDKGGIEKTTEFPSLPVTAGEIRIDFYKITADPLITNIPGSVEWTPQLI